MQDDPVIAIGMPDNLHSALNFAVMQCQEDFIPGNLYLFINPAIEKIEFLQKELRTQAHGKLKKPVPAELRENVFKNESADYYELRFSLSDWRLMLDIINAFIHALGPSEIELVSGTDIRDFLNAAQIVFNRICDATSYPETAEDPFYWLIHLALWQKDTRLGW